MPEAGVGKPAKRKTKEHLTPKVCECGLRGKCVDSRSMVNYTRRRYTCKCGKRWTTLEVRQEDAEMEE